LGTLDWIKTAWTNTTYTAGFTNQANLISSVWKYQIAPTPVLVGTNFTAVIDAGDLASPVTNAVTVNILKNAFVTAPLGTNNPTGFKPSLTAKTGLLKATFVHPATSLKTTAVGAMLQDYNYGRAAFMGTNSSGAFFLDPQP
jgi:hypothetical protein